MKMISLRLLDIIVGVHCHAKFIIDNELQSIEFNNACWEQ